MCDQVATKFPGLEQRPSLAWLRRPFHRLPGFRHHSAQFQIWPSERMIFEMMLPSLVLPLLGDLFSSLCVFIALVLSLEGAFLPPTLPFLKGGREEKGARSSVSISLVFVHADLEGRGNLISACLSFSDCAWPPSEEAPWFSLWDRPAYDKRAFTAPACEWWGSEGRFVLSRGAGSGGKSWEICRISRILQPGLFWIMRLMFWPPCT